MLLGCGKIDADKPLNLNEADQKLKDILGNEFKTAAVIQRSAGTLWIYIPLRESLMKIAATREGAQKSSTPEEKPAVRFLDASFSAAERLFLIRYDIGQQKAYPQTPGYGVEYTEAYRRISQQILSAVSRVYFTVAEPPAFFVIVLTDIQDGTEIENTFYLDDLKKYMSMEAIPQEEYMKRSLYDLKGNLTFIGDAEGKHLDYKEITRPDFLARQIAHRINFQYQRSAFPPNDDPEAEILKHTAQTLRYYSFTDFTAVRLHDLQTDTMKTINQETLKNQE
jgi:hypothetical protein